MTAIGSAAHLQFIPDPADGTDMEAAHDDVPPRHVVALPATARRHFAVRTMQADTVEADHAALVRAQRISRTGSFEYDHREQRLIISDELLALCGADREDLAFGGRVLLNTVHPDDREAVESALGDLVATGRSADLRFRSLRADVSRPIWLSARARAERDGGGNLVRVTCVVTDIDELVRAEQELHAAHAFHQAVINATPDAFHIYEIAAGSFVRANRSGMPLIGFTAAAVAVLSGDRMDDLVPLGDWAKLSAALSAAAQLADGEVAQVCHRVYEPDGPQRWLSRRLSVFNRGADGRATHLLVVSRDVTDVIEVEQLLEHAATHDELTGLPNRRYVQERFERFLTGEGISAAAVLVVDLNGFKRINDGHGHAMGDAVLAAVASRLVEATRPGDTVGRIGGDEFVVVLWTDDPDTAAALAESVAARIEQTLAEPIVDRGRECWVGASIGISVIGQDTAPESALAEADAAMYSVKKGGSKGGSKSYAVFGAALAAQARYEDHVERALRHALREDTIEVHYQPIVSPRTGLLSSVEALVRVRDEDGTILDASSVIGVAERVGLVSQVDDRVLAQACTQLAAWRATPLYRDLRLTINRSAQDILRVGFADRIGATLAATGIPAAALTLEVTETVLLDGEDDVMAGVRSLYERGVRLALDDFGTGYASLSRLTKLPISTIKIDRSFTLDMLHDRTCRALVRATVGIAEDLRLDCVVEGVETEEHLAALPRYSGLLIQGYLYGRPRPAGEGLGVNRVHW